MLKSLKTNPWKTPWLQDVDSADGLVSFFGVGETGGWVHGTELEVKTVQISTYKAVVSGLHSMEVHALP